MIDSIKLDQYLSRHIEGYAGPSSIRAFSDGQSNPTYLVSTPDRQYVLRKKPPGVLLKSAHAVDREFKVQQALYNTAVPVARVLHLCEDEQIIGTIFYVMEHLDGVVLWDPALPSLTPAQRRRVYLQMNEVLAAIHSVDIDAVGLGEFGKPGDYFARQLKRWTQQYQAADAPMSAMEPLIAWLEQHLPADDGQVTLVHGDYRIDNLMFDPDTLTIKAVFDWELSTLGHPLADLAYQIMQRSMGRDWKLSGLAGLDAEALGIPSEQEYLAAYCTARGLSSLENWDYAKVFAFFRFSAICHGVGARARAGNAASPDASKVGDMAEPLANMGWALAQGL